MPFASLIDLWHYILTESMSDIVTPLHGRVSSSALSRASHYSSALCLQIYITFGSPFRHFASFRTLKRSPHPVFSTDQTLIYDSSNGLEPASHEYHFLLLSREQAHIIYYNYLLLEHLQDTSCINIPVLSRSRQGDIGCDFFSGDKV